MSGKVNIEDKQVIIKDNDIICDFCLLDNTCQHNFDFECESVNIHFNL